MSHENMDDDDDDDDEDDDDDDAGDICHMTTDISKEILY